MHGGLVRRMTLWLRALAPGLSISHEIEGHPLHLAAMAAGEVESSIKGKHHHGLQQVIKTSPARKLLQQLDTWQPSGDGQGHQDADPGSQDQGYQGQPMQQQEEVVVIPVAALDPAPQGSSEGSTAGSPGSGEMLFPMDPALQADMRQVAQEPAWLPPDQAPDARALMAPGDAPAHLPAPAPSPAPSPTPTPGQHIMHACNIPLRASAKRGRDPHPALAAVSAWYSAWQGLTERHVLALH